MGDEEKNGIQPAIGPNRGSRRFKSSHPPPRKDIMDREQKLIDICFQLVFVATQKENRHYFDQLSTKDIMDWVADQLKTCGFDTCPVGASWGVLRQ